MHEARQSQSSSRPPDALRFDSPPPSVGLPIEYLDPILAPCTLAPASAFLQAPKVTDRIRGWRRDIAGIPDTDTGANSAVVFWRLGSSCCGWPRKPNPQEFFEAVRVNEPTARQRAIILAFTTEGDNHDIVQAWMEEAYIWAILAAALHRVDSRKYDLHRYLNSLIDSRAIFDGYCETPA